MGEAKLRRHLLRHPDQPNTGAAASNEEHQQHVSSYRREKVSVHLFPLLNSTLLVSQDTSPFVGLERRKKKNEKVKTITWRETPEENCEQKPTCYGQLYHFYCEFLHLLLVDRSIFTRQPISKPVVTGPSPLAKLLAEQEKKVSNPFFQYSKFNGEVSLRWLSC